MTRIFTGPDDESHFEDVEIPLRDLGAIGSMSELIPATGVVLRETGSEYDLDWHNAPRRQFVVMLSGGQVELEVGDGTKRRLGPGEILVALRIPCPPPRAADAYLRFIPRTEMDIAVVGAGVWLRLAADGTCAEARLALGAVGPTVIEVPLGDRVGQPVDEGALEAVAQAASAAARPIDDKRGTVEYRRHVSGVLAKRALRIAADRAAQRSE